MTNDRKNHVLLGKIGAAHGIKGGVRIASYTANPLDLASYGPLETNRPGLVVTLVDAKLMKNTVIAKLKGITDRNGAEALNGVELYLDRGKLPDVEDDDDFYHADLIGLQARLEDGTVIGTVLSVPNFGAGDLLEVGDKASGKTEFYPFTRAVVPVVSVEQGYITIAPPAMIEDEGGDEGDQPGDMPDGDQ